MHIQLQQSGLLLRNIKIYGTEKNPKTKTKTSGADNSVYI